MSIPAKSSKAELLKLPEAEWNEEEWYDSLLIVPTRRKHDSGWAHIAIIGCNGDEAIKIIAQPDDIQWPKNESGYAFRTDAYYPSGVLRVWSNRYRFTAEHYSSSEIRLKEKEPKK